VKKRDKEDVYIAALACRDQIPATPWDRANVTIDLYVKSNVTRDADNLYATVKGSLDGLKRAGIIKDDSTAVIGTPTIRVFKDTERAYEYVITLEERP
jgi:Holliday junction resolvase RusA-like endonuclease